MYKEYLNEGDIINLRHLQLSILRCWMNVVRKGIFQRNVKTHIIWNYGTVSSVFTFNKYIIRIETFDDTGFRNNLKKYYPSYAYWLVLISVLGVPFRLFCRKLKIKDES